MRRLRTHSHRVDRMGHDIRRRRGSIGKWVYLIALLALLAWLLNLFLGDLFFFSAQGFVVREQNRVSVPYTAKVARLNVEVGDQVKARQQLAKVDSLTIQETIAELSQRIAENDRELTKLKAQRIELGALLPLAERRAKRMEDLLEQNTDAYGKGLTTSNRRSTLIEDEFQASEKLAQIRAERSQIGQQMSLIEEQQADLRRRRNLFQKAYDGGVVRAPAAGRVFDIAATMGEVVRAADPIVTLVSGQAYVLAYVNPGTLADLPVGSKVTLEYGAREISGSITQIFPISKQLPQEFQRQFRPQERSQLIRIDFASDAEPPPTFTKLTVTSAEVLPSWAQRLFDRIFGGEDASKREEPAQQPSDAAEKTKGQDAAISRRGEREPRQARPDDRNEATQADTATASDAGPEKKETRIEAAPREKPALLGPRDLEPATQPGQKDGTSETPDSKSTQGGGPAQTDAFTDSWRVQLGAFKAEKPARTGIRRLYAGYWPPPGATYKIVTNQENGGVIYRLQLGPFDSRRQADAHCQRMKKAGHSCILRAPDS